MNIYFCETCGTRVSDQDIEQGLGYKTTGESAFCKACYRGTPAKGAATPGNTSRLRKKSSGSIPRPNAQALSGARVPTSVNVARTPGKSGTRLAPPAPSSSVGIYAGIAAVVIIGIGAVLWHGSSSTPPPNTTPKPNPAVTDKIPEKNPVTPQTTPNEPTPPQTQTTKTPPPPVESTDPVQRDFDEMLRKVQALPPQDPRRVEAAEEFIKKHEESILASRARRIAEDAKRVESPAPTEFKSASEYSKYAYSQLPVGNLDAAFTASQKACAMPDATWKIWAVHAIICWGLEKEKDFNDALAKAKVGSDAAQVEAEIRREGPMARTIYKGKRLEGRELSNATDFMLRGDYRVTAERFNDAIADYNQALKLDPVKMAKSAYQSLANVAEDQRDWKGKLEAYRRWSEMTPPSAEGCNAYAWEMLTSQDEKLRNLSAGLTMAEKAATLSESKNPSILDTLALALFRNGKIKEAVQKQELAISLLPANYPAQSRKDFESRLQEFKAALK